MAAIAVASEGKDVAAEASDATETAEETEEGSMANQKTPEELLAAEADQGEAEEVKGFSTEDIADAEEADSLSDAFSDADAREEQIEMQNDAIDELANQAQEVSDEGIDGDGNDRG